MINNRGPINDREGFCDEVCNWICFLASEYDGSTFWESSDLYYNW